MHQDLFRKSALQTLSSPDRLDGLMTLTSRRSWISLAAIGVLLVVLLLWSIFGSLPTSVTGHGIIVRKGGSVNIVANGNGVIAQMKAWRVGEKISKGQVIARIPQPVLALQVELAQVELQALGLEARAIGEAVLAEQAMLGAVSREQKELQQQIVNAKNVQIASLRKVQQQQEELLTDGLITRQRVEESRQAILAAQNDIGSTQSQFRQLAVRELESAAQRDERLRVIRSRIGEAQNKFKALQLQQILEGEIVSEHDGLVIETMARQGDTVKAGQPVLSMEREQRTLEAVIYLAPQSGGRTLEPGMAAQVSPADAKRERYGYLIGKVVAVAKYPATEQGMMTVLNNAGLVREMSKSGPPLAVVVELLPDPATASGYSWSGSAGREIKVNSGTLATASFVTTRSRPIALLLPLLRESAGL